MKLHFGIDKQPLNGFINIDPTKQRINFGDLNPICEASEAKTIIINEMLNYVDINNIPQVLQSILTRLRHKGVVTIIFTDVHEVGRTIKTGGIDIVNALVFGKGQARKQSLFGMKQVIDILKGTGLNILSKEVSDCTVTIKAQRP